MFKKINNRILLIIFVLLAVAAAVVWLLDSRKGERTFRKELFSVDSAQVTSITVIPKGNTGNQFNLQKTGQGWEVRYDEKSFPADTMFIGNLLQTLSGLKPERVVGVDESNWKEFDVTDSAATHVILGDNGATMADFYIGRVSFAQSEQPQGYGRNRNPSVKSHVRIADDERVYMVDGFLSMMFSDKPSRYREKTICRFAKEQVTRFTFSYPGDSSFILEKAGGRWLVNGSPADSAKVENYLRSVAGSVGSEFEDDAGQVPLYAYTLTIEGNSMPVIEIRGAISAQEPKKYYLNSSVNPTAVFGGTSPYLFTRIFTGKSKLVN